MRFLIAMVKDGNPITRIDFGGTIGEKWATTTQAVVDFAKKKIKGHAKDNSYPGDEVEVEYTVTNGKYNVTRITPLGGSSASTNNTSNTTEKCSDCGKKLKDSKYTKCYNCNKANPVKKSTQELSNGKFRTPEQITRDEVGHMTARTMVGLAGVIDPNNVTDVIKNVYQTYRDLVK